MSQEYLDEMSKQFNSVMKMIEDEQEEMWNRWSKAQQLAAFCCVVRRIVEGELVDKGSYRHILYTTFGFGPESYAQAQVAGFLDLHNSIFGADHDVNLLKAFAAKHNIEDGDAKAAEFLL